MINATNIVLQRADGAILLQLRSDKPEVKFGGYWGLPGGSCEGNELPIDAICRELLEETGYYVDKKDISLIGTVFVKSQDINLYVYFAKYDGVSRIACYEGNEMSFVCGKDIKHLDIVPFHLKFIKKYAKN